ncbi:glycosyltransferase [Natrialbaceae archaeon AArc-T1-2]|uniref:glycosyltransferase n=1 Tax=Natrialbaceae archaeon AArc-T1-2 TaxID=3053904 RepID=UPI00255B1A64|nr:glycosyltransferase [Natrialbaceae archaeon AArc-T1-2]WIV66370.1 glycosyltransferase [Natrialbaceae archaeon AArc-T1-2]
MNVLYYLDWFPKLSQSFVLNEIHYLVQNGHNVAVFSLNEPDTDVEHDELNDIDIEVVYADEPSVTSVPKTLSRSIVDDRVSYEPFFRRPRRRFGTRYLTKQCLDFIETLPYDIDHVHSHFARWNKIPAALVADAGGATSSLTTHAYDLYASPDEEALKFTCDAFDSVFTISEYNKQFIDAEIDPDATVEVVRMGIRTEKFQPTETPDEPRLLTIARFVEKKGIEYALYAVAAVVDDYPELDYRIIGSGPRKQRYQEIIAEEGIEDNVTFLGSVSDDQLIDELDRAKAFLLPCIVAKDGDRDGIPVVLMEAMAMKTPPITTNVSGIPELVSDSENGFLVNPRDTHAISSKIYTVLRGDEEINKIRRKSRKTIEETYDIYTKEKDLGRLFMAT